MLRAKKLKEKNSTNYFKVVLIKTPNSEEIEIREEKRKLAKTLKF